jgi:hypothetical protein
MMLSESAMITTNSRLGPLTTGLQMFYRTLTIASLPFINDNGYGLAIATRTYLDAINKDGVQPTDKLKGQIKAQEEPYTWFQFVPNLSKNLDNAFKLWDAVGVVLIPAL